MSKRTQLPLLSLIAFSLLATPAMAQQPAGAGASLKVAVVDLQKALLQVPDGKRAKSTLEKLAASKKKELETKKAALEKAADEFKRQGSLLTDAVKRQKIEELQKGQYELQQLAFQAEQDLKSKEVKMLKPISEKLEKTIEKIAKAKGYDLVLHAAGVAYFRDALDITPEVIAQYGK